MLLGSNEDKGVTLLLLVPSDRTRGSARTLQHTKPHPHPRKSSSVSACARSVCVLRVCVCLGRGGCVCLCCVGVWCVGAGGCVTRVCGVVSVVCACVLYAQRVSCARCVFVRVRVLWLLCVSSVHAMVVEVCVWPQPVLSSMGVPRGPKSNPSPRETPGGLRGTGQWGLWGT